MSGERTPWQADRDRVEGSGKWPPSWGPYHRHFGSDAVHRDGGPECDQPGSPRRVYMFDPDYLDEHERNVAAYAVQHPAEFVKVPGRFGYVAHDAGSVGQFLVTITTPDGVTGGMLFTHSEGAAAAIASILNQDDPRV